MKRHSALPGIMHGRACKVIALAMGLTATALWAPAMAASTGPVTLRVSVGAHTPQAHASSFAGSVSADGRLVVFTSRAANVIKHDTNQASDVFVRDRTRGSTFRASLTAGDQQANGQSFGGYVSANGRYVVFESDATNLVPGDTNGDTDVFVRDLATGTTHRASVSSLGIEANGSSLNARISPDGRYVFFVSNASNLVAGDTNGRQDAFVWDGRNGTTTRVSVSSSGVQANGPTWWGDISAGGRFIAFLSSAKNLVPNDTNLATDVFVHDIATGVTRRVSVSTAGVQADGGSGELAISANGRFVVFASIADTLVRGDRNGVADVFIRDRALGATRRVSLSAGGIPGNGDSGSPVISPTGRFVAFVSTATNLVPGDTNGHRDVFVRDLQARTTVRVSVSTAGVQANGPSARPAITAAGRWVEFDSLATNLVATDTNSVQDVFVYGPRLIAH